MFEITTRPPNSFVFQNNQQQQQQHHHQNNIQHQTDVQQHRRNQAIQQQFRHSPRSSSLANNNFDSARNFPQFFFHNNYNNLTHQNLNNNIIYKLPVSLTNNNGDLINQDRYVTKIITSNNNNNNDKSKNLTSSSLSYFNPNDTLSTDLTQIKYSNNGTILPVYYKNESTGQTSAINNTLPTVRNIPVINSISKPPLNTKSNNLLPNLINTNNNNGSAGTAVVTITSNNNYKNNGVKTFNSFTNLTDNSNDFNRSSAKTTHIPITHSKINESEYPLKLNSKQYSVIKGIRARQEMLSSGGLSANNINLYNNYSNFKNNNDSKLIQSTNDTLTNKVPEVTENLIRQDTINSLESSSSSLNNFQTNKTRNNSTNTVKKSILVNRKKISNPVNSNKKTVSFAF
jgi:hypothetical protein